MVTENHPRPGRPTPRIRPAGREDLAGILAVEQASFDHPGEVFSRRQIAGLIANPRALVLVAVSKGEVLGWAAGLARKTSVGRSGRVYALAVGPHARGLGLGRKLMARIIAAMRGAGAGNIYLEVRSDNAPAVNLYLKLGFHHVRPLPHYYDRGRHAVKMMLPAGIK